LSDWHNRTEKENRSVGLQSDARGFVWSKLRNFDVHRNAHAQQFSPCGRRLAFALKLFIIGEAQSCFETARVISFVINNVVGVREAGSAAIEWQLTWLNQIAPPNFGAIDFQNARRFVEQPLHNQGRLRSSGARKTFNGVLFVTTENIFASRFGTR